MDFKRLPDGEQCVPQQNNTCVSIFYIWFREAFCSFLPLEKYLPKSTTWVKFETSVIPQFTHLWKV